MGLNLPGSSKQNSKKPLQHTSDGNIAEKIKRMYEHKAKGGSDFVGGRAPSSICFFKP